MNKRPMLEIAREFLKKNKESTFNQIWSEIAKELKPYWKEEKTDLKFHDLEGVKKGQFYKLLTLDGGFLRLRNSKWILTEEYSFHDANKLKIFYTETASSEDDEIKDNLHKK